MELAYHAQLDTRLCMGLHLHDDAAPPAHEHGHHHHHGPLHHMPAEMDAPIGDQTQFDGHVHSGLDSHHHGEDTHEHFHGHDPGWQSFLLSSTDPQDPEKLKQAVSEVALRQPVLRAKGHVAIPGKHHALVLQAVRARIQTYYDAHDHAPAKSSIVFIGYHPKRQQVAEILHDFTGTHWA